MTEQVAEQSGVCPDATGIMVFRDGEGRWRGRFHDEVLHTQSIVLPSHDGEQAQQTLANYLGVPSQRVRVFEATGRRY